MLDIGDLITLSNGREYIVISQTKFDEKDYVYLVSKDSTSVAVCLLENNTLQTISDGELIKLLLEKFKQEQNIEDE